MGEFNVVEATTRLVMRRTRPKPAHSLLKNSPEINRDALAVNKAAKNSFNTNFALLIH
jgi:hypothetical protein